MSTTPGAADENGGAGPKRAGKLSTLLIAVVVAVLAVAAVVWFVALPQVEKNRQQVRKEACAANLRLIGKALLAYEKQHGHFPPPYLADEKGRPMHSWRVLILPFTEDNELKAIYQQYSFGEPWNGPNNRRLLKKAPPVFRCPSDADEDESGGGETSYLAVLGPGTVFDGVRPANFSGGPGEAVVVVEAARSGVNWLEPRDLELKDMPPGINPSADKGIRSRHPGGANVLCGDGQARWLPDSTPPEQLTTQLSISGGEDLWSGDEESLR